MNATIQSHVEALTQTAIAHAQQHYGVKLEFDESGIAALEKILAEVYTRVPHSRVARFFSRKPDFSDVARIANMYGAFLGEVIRRRCGGEWTETELCGCEHILVLRIGSDLSLMPTTKTWNRVTMGQSENVLNYFHRTLERFTTTESATSAS